MSTFDIFGNREEGASLDSQPLYATPSFHLPLDEMEDRVEAEAPASRQFTPLIFLFIAVISVLIFQCFRLQITEGLINQSLADGNSLRLITIPAERGLILDLNGKTLAQNTRKLALGINPLTLPGKRVEREKVYTALRGKAGISPETITLIEDNRLKSPEIFAIKTNLSQEEGLLYKEWFGAMKGPVMMEIPVRIYTDLPSMGHLLGYVGSVDEEDVARGFTLDQRIGKSGLEKVYHQELTGQPGKQKAEVNALGEIVRAFSVTLDTQPQPGKTLQLSLDSNLQQIVADALHHELERRTKKFGEQKDLGASAVVIDPTTGAVRAMVSLPDYSANSFGQGISQKEYEKLINNPANPLLNRTIQGQYPPGSSIKPSLAAAGLQDGIISVNTTMTTPEAIMIGQFRFPDWKLHGLTNTRQAIAESNDIFFYAVGGGWEERQFKGLGIERMNHFFDLFGFGKKSGIDLPGEYSGLLGDPKWKKEQRQEDWYIGDTYHSAIGQGFTLATPLQMANATAAIANGGTLWKPTLLWSITDVSKQEKHTLPRLALQQNFIDQGNLKTVREGMRQTVESGSARPLRTLKVTSAGKTGTAEFGTKGMTHSWYTGFAPYENPELAFAIVIEGGGDSYYSAVPVAEEILRNYFGDPLAPGQKLNSEPDLSNPEFRGEH